MKSSQFIFLVAAILIALPAFGQENNHSPPGGRIKLDAPPAANAADTGVVDDPTLLPKSSRLKNKDLPQISIIDKLLSIESALSGKLQRSTEGEWVKDYNVLYQKFKMDGNPSRIRGGGKNIAYTAMALGVKASDGVMALKARNIEALKNASDQIEVLARKLGATEGELGMANTVKIYANKNQWFNAFLALGRLQRDVLNYLRSNPEKKDQAVLVIVGGWLQGGRCVTHVIDSHYDDYVSNILREQRLVAMIRENMEQLAPVYLNDPLVAEIIKELPEIYQRVNVGLKEPVKQEDVRWLHNNFETLVAKIMTPEEPEVATTEVTDGNAVSAPPSQPPPPATVEQPPPSPPKPADAASTVENPAPPQPLPASDRAAPAKPDETVQQPAGRSIWPVILVVALLAASIAGFLIRRKGNR